MGKSQADAADLLSTALTSAYRDGLNFGIPAWTFEALVNVARLPAAEPASHEAMRLLCLIAQAYYGMDQLNVAGIKTMRFRGSPADPSDSRSMIQGPGDDAESHMREFVGSNVCATLARLGAATAALAHLQRFRQAPGIGVRCEAPRLTSGAVARFVSWVCAAPRVFLDLRDRGLLEVLVDVLRSSKGGERTDAGLAVTTLMFCRDAARAPLRSLGAITPMTKQLTVCLGLS
jgi:hypothetical protein